MFVKMLMFWGFNLYTIVVTFDHLLLMIGLSILIKKTLLQNKD